MTKTENILDAHRWRRHAEEDLAEAQAILARASAAPRHACWLAEQCVEKALKGGLILLGTEPPRSLDLEGLRRLLPEDWRVPTASVELRELGEYAVKARYPGDWPEQSASDARLAVQRARSVLETVRAAFARHGVQIEKNQ